MKYIEATVIINVVNQSLAEDLIVSIFDDLGLNGVVVEDPHIAFETVPPDTLAGSDSTPADHAVTGYFPVDSTEKKQCDALESALTELKRSQNVETVVSYRTIDEEEWAESWKAFFLPEKVGDRVVVKPTWHDYHANPEEIVVEIDPGMAFGTGTHPTTALSVQMLEKHVHPGQRMLDVGTGSGILLISAVKLGVGSGIGIDNDFVATVVASSNLAQNQIDPQRFSVVQGNLIESVKGRFDLITANILADVIIELISLLEPVLAPEGVFICSGIIKAKEEPVEKRLLSSGFHLVEKRVQDEWVCIAARFGRSNHAVPTA